MAAKHAQDCDIREAGHGVYSSLQRHSEKAASDDGVDTRAIVTGVGKRKMVGGQEI